MYFLYLKERTGLDAVETNYGFATYKFRGQDCYVEDIFVLPEFRKQGKAAEMADKVAEIAKSKGVHILTGSVDTRANGAATSTQVLRAYGMIPYTQEGPVIYYRKEI